MPLTEKLRGNFWGLALGQGRMELEEGKEFYCFFIVDQAHDTEFIKKQALSLIVAGCRDFHFYGRQEPVWHLEVDSADILVNPEMKEVAMTSGYQDIDDFVFELSELLSLRPLVPFMVYLIYDSRTIYDDVLLRLREQGLIQ